MTKKEYLRKLSQYSTIQQHIDDIIDQDDNYIYNETFIEFNKKLEIIEDQLIEIERKNTELWK